MGRPIDCLIGLGLNESPYGEAKREAAALRLAIKEHNDSLIGSDEFRDYAIDVSHIPVTD